MRKRFRRGIRRTFDFCSAKRSGLRVAFCVAAPKALSGGDASRFATKARASDTEEEDSVGDIFGIFSDPAAIAALVTLVVMEVVLGIDNLIFISILSNKLPEEQRQKARRIGIGLALGMRLALLSMIAWLVGLTAPVFDLGITGPPGAHGEPAFETQFSWRDLILIAGGLFLVWKATKEIHHNVDPHPSDDMFDAPRGTLTFGTAIGQIVLLDIVFSIDSILTAVGMTDYLVIMVIAVVVAVVVMLVAADPMANFINRNPTVVMLALGFLLMIGAVLIADGFGVHVPKGYIYAAMAFSAGVEALNIFARRRQERRAKAGDGGH
jgi:predicted tellurium resistance membrane protein TerC